MKSRLKLYVATFVLAGGLELTAGYKAKRDSGTFKLADRIAAKIKAGDKINYVFSYQASGIPLFSPQYAAGFDTGCKLGNAITPLECASIAPVPTAVTCPRLPPG